MSLIAFIGIFTFMADLFRLMAGPYVLPVPVQALLGLDRLDTTYITGNKLMILIDSVALPIVAWFLINKTFLGLAWRATEQDFETASAFGVNQDSCRYS